MLLIEAVRDFPSLGSPARVCTATPSLSPVTLHPRPDEGRVTFVYVYTVCFIAIVDSCAHAASAEVCAAHYNYFNNNNTISRRVRILYIVLI